MDTTADDQWRVMSGDRNNSVSGAAFRLDYNLIIFLNGVGISKLFKILLP